MYSAWHLARNSTQKMFAECWGKKKEQITRKDGGEDPLRVRECHKFTQIDSVCLF